MKLFRILRLLFWPFQKFPTDRDVKVSLPVKEDDDLIDSRGGFFSSEHARNRDAALRQWAEKNAFTKPSFVNVDVSVKHGVGQDSILDSYDASAKNVFSLGSQSIATPVLTWYVSQGFIGHQACAMLSQHWLISIACSAKGEDAVRNGWTINFDDGDEIDPETINRVNKLDEKYKVVKNLTEAHKYKNVFGIRHVLTLVDSKDLDYYEKPFNPDGIKPGSYKGFSQIDPYWMSPLLDQNAISSPSNKDFYEPTYWVISGRKYHKSHFVIIKGPDVPDVLKPSYLYGGIPLTQQIYERVYAAERTANEAPALTMTKRLYTREVDLKKAAANQRDFEENLAAQAAMKDNHGMLIHGKGEAISQLDTNLTDVDVTIMTQYQLVAAICKVPATRLLGTSPKGFNATGEHEIKTYHEHLESVQTNDFDPILERHYICLSKSSFNGVDIKHVWNPVSMPSEDELANLQSLKAQTDKTYVEIGAVDAYDIRDKLIADEDSGYTGIEPVERPEDDLDDVLTSSEPDNATESGDTAMDDVGQENGRWYVFKKGTREKIAGPYTRKRQAVKRLGQIEHFKEKG